MQVLYKSPETLFTYTQCFFCPPAVGHVSYHSQNPELVSKLHSGGRDLRRSNVPGLCPYQEFFLLSQRPCAALPVSFDAALHRPTIPDPRRISPALLPP